MALEGDDGRGQEQGGEKIQTWPMPWVLLFVLGGSSVVYGC